MLLYSLIKLDSYLSVLELCESFYRYVFVRLFKSVLGQYFIDVIVFANSEICEQAYSNCFATVSLTSEKADVTGFTGLTCQPFYLGIISLVTPKLNAYSALVKKVDYESFACIYRCAVS